MGKRFDFKSHKEELILMEQNGVKVKKIMDYICDTYGFVVEESVIRKKLKEWSEEKNGNN